MATLPLADRNGESDVGAVLGVEARRMAARRGAVAPCGTQVVASTRPATEAAGPSWKTRTPLSEKGRFGLTWANSASETVGDYERSVGRPRTAVPRLGRGCDVAGCERSDQQPGNAPVPRAGGVPAYHGGQRPRWRRRSPPLSGVGGARLQAVRQPGNSRIRWAAENPMLRSIPRAVSAVSGQK